MPILLLIPLGLATGALAYNSVTRDTTAVVQSTVPNIALLAALALAGVVVWKMASR